jgi:pilus assembly protein CpaF
MPVIVIQGGEYKGERIEIPARENMSIGRSLQSDIILRDSEVSSRHAQIIRRERDYWIQDLGSTNGTLIDKRKIVQQRLNAGQEFNISYYRLTFVESGEAFTEEQEATLEEIRRGLHAALIDELNLKQLTLEQMQDKSLRKRASDALTRLVTERRQEIPPEYDPDELKKSVLDTALGLGPLEDLLADREVTEIMVNGPDKIFIERSGKVGLTEESFMGQREVLTAIERIVGPLGRRIDESSPMVDARLQDGSRVNAIIPPLAIDSPTITIRKFPEKQLDIGDLIGYNSLTQQMADFLRICAIHAKNIVVSGGTGSGKTTFLNIASGFIPDDERIITIEDSAELRLPQPHVVRLETRPANIEGKGAVTIRDLVKNSLRMRPDRIVVGECRGGECLDMLQAMNTGHDGSLTTAHANSPEDTMRRLESMVLMSGIELPLRAVRELIVSAVDLVVQISRFSDGTRKVIAISEITGMYEGDIQLQEIFGYHRTGIRKDGRVVGYFAPTGVIPEFVDELREAGVGVDMSMFVPQSEGDK